MIREGSNATLHRHCVVEPVVTDEMRLAAGECKVGSFFSCIPTERCLEVVECDERNGHVDVDDVESGYECKAWLRCSEHECREGVEVFPIGFR